MSLDDYSTASSDPRSILLPLLKPEAGVAHADAPPLHHLPDGKLSGQRVAFKTSSPGGEVDWVSTTHTYPAAYPRSHALSTRPPSSGPLKVVPLPQEALQSAEAEKAHDKRKRQEDMQAWKTKMSFIDDWSQYFPPKSAEEGMQRAKEGVKRKDPQLWNVIQRIVPSKRTAAKGNKAKEPVTLFLAHATGFHKEIYEPFFKHLAQQVSDFNQDAEGTVEIEEIWSLDTIISGESALLNQESFGPAVHWLDAARDIVQFASSFMPPQPESSPSAQVLPAQLPHSSSSGAGNPRKRRIIGMGHSYAGAAIALVANTFPEIFERVILLDPILISDEMLKASLEYAHENPDDPNPMGTPKGHPLAMGAALRKDVWANREAAERSFRSKPFFRAWSKDVLDLHLRFGLVPLKGAEPQVTLAMPKWLEASSFAASWTSSYARASILSGNFKKHHADSSKGKTHIIIMSEGNRSINLEAFGEELGDSPDKLLRGTVEVMEGGHLSAQEQPSNLASWVLAHLLDRKPPATKPDKVKARL